MVLQELQVQIRDLVMGPGTRFWCTGFNPYQLRARADQTGPRAWGHGTWSGAEWADERVVAGRVWAITGGPAEWVDANEELAEAWRPVGDSDEQVELRWVRGGKERVLFGTPRIIDQDVALISGGVSLGQFQFVSQDPRIYFGQESVATAGLPVQTGGLIVPVTVPLSVDGVLAGGRANLLNEGRAEAPLTFRIDGPVLSPTVVVQRPDGTIQQVRFDLELAAGQFMNVDSRARTALINGLPQSNQRGRATWDLDQYPLLKGTNVLRYMAGGFNETTLITARWRSATW